MPLTIQERQRLEQIMRDRQSAPAPAENQASALSPQEKARLEALIASRRSAVSEDAPVPEKKEGLLMKSARAVQAVPSAILNIPGVKQITEASSYPFVQASKGIGQIVGAVGTPIANLLKGKSLTEGLAKNVKQSGEDTARFSRDLTAQTPVIAAQQTLGKIPNLILGGSQVVTGAGDVVKGIREGDKEKALTGGIEAGLGVLGLLGIRGQKGAVLDKRVSEPVVSRSKALMTGKPVAQVRQEAMRQAITKSEPILRDVLQITPPQSKKIQRGLLQEARQKRAGIEVEPRKPVERTMLEEGLLPETQTRNGRLELDTDKSVLGFDELINAHEDKLEQILSTDKNPVFDLGAMKAKSLQDVEKIQNISATERISMRAEVAKYFDDEIAERGRFIDALNANQVKRGFTNAGDYKNLSPGQKHMRQSAGIVRKAIEDYFGNKIPIKDINRILGDFIEARNFLQSKQGTVVKGGLLGKRLASIAGSVAGRTLSSVPVLGEFLGYQVGGMLNDYAISPDRKLGNILQKTEGFIPPSETTMRKAEAGARDMASSLQSMPRLVAPAKRITNVSDQSGIVPGYTPKPGVQVPRPGQKALPPGQSVIAAEGRTLPKPVPKPIKSGILTQKQAVAQLKSEGYTGPLTKQEIKQANDQAVSDARFEEDLLRQLKKETSQPFNIQGMNEDEVQLAYARFKSLANRSKKTLDPSVDAAALLKQIGVLKYGKLMRPTAGGNLTDDELLDVFKSRFLLEQEVPF